MENKNILCKENVNMVKGLAIILMVIHHTFAFPERISDIDWTSSLFNIEVHIAEFGRICVFIYLFLSGYGLFYYAENNNGVTYKDIIKRAIKLLKRYWLIMILFIPLGFLLKVYTLNIKEFIMNFLTVSYSYNGEWWFVNTYILLIFIFPIIYKYINKIPVLGIIGISLVINMISITVGLIINNIDNILLIRSIRLVLIYQLDFITGCIFYKYMIMDKIYQYMQDRNLNKLTINIIMLLSCVAIRKITTIADFMIGPIVILNSILIIKKLKLEKIFSFMSRHSTNIWLTHSFFCYYYFQELIFWPKYSMLIILWIMLLTICCSHVINIISNITYKKYFNIRSKLLAKSYT